MNILIAEDDADLNKLVRYQLEQEGHNCTAVFDGMKALEAMQVDSFDIAVFDVMMPRLDGFNLLRKMRESGNQTPVIFLTARGDDMDKVLGLGMGADDYIVKPFSMAELIARVNAVLRRCYKPSGEMSSRIQYGALMLDTAGCDVTVNGVSAGLNAKEYKILKLMMENPGRVFTKKQLYHSVWDEDVYYDDNTVMVHISHLRNKIERDTKDPKYLRTIRSIGYKFQCDEDQS